MVRHALLIALLAVWLPLGDPEPTPFPSPKPTPKLSAPSPNPSRKAEAEAAPKAEALLANHRLPPYELLPLAPSYAGPEPTYRATRRDYDPHTPVYGAPAVGYDAPEVGYDAPAAGYDAPGRGSGNDVPKRSYDAPSHGYAAPVEQYCYPKTHFTTTWRRMTQYKTHWATQQQLVPFTKYKYVTATSYWQTTHTEWKEVLKTLPYRRVAKTQVVHRTKTLLEKHQDFTNTEYVWHTQNYMDHHTVTKHITQYATKTNYYTDTVTELVQKPEYYTETAIVYEAKYHTKKVTQPYYETTYKTVKKPEQIYMTEYQTKQQYHTVYRTHAEKVYHTVTKCPGVSVSYRLPTYH